jgi:hypothetical protein
MVVINRRGRKESKKKEVKKSNKYNKNCHIKTVTASLCAFAKHNCK